ncbi:hypothetical protein OG21DRAFT_304525 [Imleria badia]|nr:hypothetical protein OG21DRAFT_304525 [Imleria badia]
MAGSGYVTDAKRNLAFMPMYTLGNFLIRSDAGTAEPITAPVLREHDPSTQPAKSPAGSTRVLFSETRNASTAISSPPRRSPVFDADVPYFCATPDDHRACAHCLYDPPPRRPLLSAHRTCVTSPR